MKVTSKFFEILSEFLVRNYVNRIAQNGQNEKLRIYAFKNIKFSLGWYGSVD